MKSVELSRIIGLLSFFLCLFIISLSLAIFPHEDHQLGNEKTNVYQYKYFERDHLSNENTNGIVTLNDEIDGFISFNKGNGDEGSEKSALISSFGTEEYECFGSCYCDDEKTNRRVSNNRVLNNGISYLMAAVSSIVAIDRAKEYFSEKCAEDYTNICEFSQSLKSEVHECIETEIRLSEEEKEKHFQRVYFCYGNCVENLKFAINAPTAKNQGLDCSKLKFEGEVVIDPTELKSKGKVSPIASRSIQAARGKFGREFLNPFCKEKSQKEYVHQIIQENTLGSGEKKRYYYNMKKVQYLCLGIGAQSRWASREKNTRCFLIEPKSRSSAAEYWRKRWWAEKKKWDDG